MYRVEYKFQYVPFQRLFDAKQFVEKNGGRIYVKVMAD